MGGEWNETMAALKGLVIVMAVLIVVTVAAIGYGLYKKSSDPEFTFFGGDAAPAPAGPTPPSVITTAPSFGEIGVVMPRGCEIVDMKPAGPLLHVRLGGGEGCQRIVVVDVERGAVRGSIVLGVRP